MTSNFISNIAHFDKYKCIYGLTGTLGSKSSKKFIHKNYDVYWCKFLAFKKDC